MGEIYDWVRNTVIYLILNTIIMNLLGNSSYKKYVNIIIRYDFAINCGVSFF